MSLNIGISLGDVTGVGPEVTLKAIAALQSEDDTRYLLIGDAMRLRELNARINLKLHLEDFTKHTPPGRFLIANPITMHLPANLKPGEAVAANAAVSWLQNAGERCLRGEIDAMVTAPVNKEAIICAGHKFIGQTEFLTELAHADRTVMMLLGHDERGRWLRVALATVHIAIRDVPAKLTQERVVLAIARAVGACRDLGLPRARVAVCGLNPHCGEGGESARAVRAHVDVARQETALHGRRVRAVPRVGA